MSPRLPRVTADELLRALHRDGSIEVRQSGSHVILENPNKSGRAVVPRHAGVTLKLKVVADVLAQTGLTSEELRKLL
jgi:predicted RNA binding protein YcfA (HicA-like mRNA interferase family)